MFKKNKYKKISYSQSGEDLIIDFIFSAIDIEKPSYIDIGAHHPFYLSNTAILYEKGCHGICIEPDPILFKEIKKYRKNDICLNIGIGLTEETKIDEAAEFYIMASPTLNTFSKEQALEYEKNCNQKIKEVKNISLHNINTIINKYLTKSPNFISLDVEGLDLDVLKTFNFEQFQPEVFCIETITYSENNLEEKVDEITDFMLSKGYIVYADTYINTIFIYENVWRNR